MTTNEVLGTLSTMLGPTPEDVALAEELVTEATSELAATTLPHVMAEVRRRLVQEMLETEEGLRELRRVRADEIRRRKKPPPQVHPDDLAWISDRPPSAPSTPEELHQIDRGWTISHILATRAAETVKGALPQLLHDLLWFELAHDIALHPYVDPIVDAATSHWQAPEGLPDPREDILLSRPDRGPNARLFAGMEQSASDFLLAVPKPEATLTGSAAASELERSVLGLTAALLSGALAAIERLKEKDRKRALLEMAQGRRLLEEHLSSLSPAARADFERVSLQLDLLPRHETMDVLSWEDRRIHYDAMVAFGASLGRRLATPLLLPPTAP